MHYYTVEFRIEGLELNPSTITTDLGLQPCQIRDFTDFNKGSTSRKRHNLWAYDGFSPNEKREEDWDSLETGLLYVMANLLPKKEQIAALSSRYQVYWWCGHFQNSFDGGPRFSPSLLLQLADIGVELMLDNYQYED